MTPIDVLFLIEASLGLSILLVSWLWLFPEAFADEARMGLQRIQSGLLIHGLNGRIDLASERYEDTKKFLESAKSLLPHLSVWYLVALWMSDKDHLQREEREQADEFTEIDMAIVRIMLRYVVRRSVLLSTVRLLGKLWAEVTHKVAAPYHSPLMNEIAPELSHAPDWAPATLIGMRFYRALRPAWKKYAREHAVMECA